MDGSGYKGGRGSIHTGGTPVCSELPDIVDDLVEFLVRAYCSSARWDYAILILEDEPMVSVNSPAAPQAPHEDAEEELPDVPSMAALRIRGASGLAREGRFPCRRR
eukprot:4999498-Pleurochrysis_carterae.AAC.9